MSQSLIDLVRSGIRNPGRIPSFVRDYAIHSGWEVWESLGFHISPNHFYYPIPDSDDLRKKRPWDMQYPMAGINLREDEQLNLLKDLSETLSDFSHTESGMINYMDAAVLYGMIQKQKPDRILEVGSGLSTEVALNASEGLENSTVEVISIEPYPNENLTNLTRNNNNHQLIEKRAEDVPVEEYLQLEQGDFLFIDSSHTLAIGNDVSHIYLRCLPQLYEGVYIHLHDIFFPSEYPKEWTMERRRFWTEQYLLQAFLMFNDSFEVLWSANHIYQVYPDAVEEHLPKANEAGGSFWMKRTDNDPTR
jgi:predicted O-methyltransferase YrrM